MSQAAPQASVRGRLLRLALLLVLPGLLLSALLTWRIFVTTRRDAETALLETARGLDLLVEHEFTQAELLLRTLAATDELQPARLAAFDRLARATTVMGGAIVLVDSSGQELVDTALPAGAALPRTAPVAGWAREVIGQPFISGLTHAADGTANIQVVLPVGIAGVHRTDLKLIVPPSSFQAIITRNPLPAGWTTSVTDAAGVFIARTRAPERFIGHPAGIGLLSFLPYGGEEVRNSISADGVPVVVAFIRSPHSGYVVAVNVSRALIAQAGELSTVLLVGFGSIASLLGLLGALWVARRISRPIEAMAEAARALGEIVIWQALPTSRQPLGLAEADAVRSAMEIAARTLVERQEALRDLNDTLAARVRVRTAELASANAALEEQGSRLGAILDQMPVGVVVHQADGKLLFANREARRLAGLPPTGPIDEADWPTLRKGQTVLPPEQHPSALALRGLVTEALLLSADLPNSAGPMELEVNASPIRDSEGRITLSVNTMQDVTARLEAEEARRRSQRLEAVGQLTGGVAHEFNNLLMAISGCLDLLAPYVASIPAEQRGARAASLLANATRATSRGGRLTGQLLAFARRQHLQVESVDLNALVGGMKELLESTLGRAIEVRVILNETAWPAMADPSQLELVLLNLAINARDAMPSGGRLVIRTGSTRAGPTFRPEDPPEGDHAVLEVSDTGEGMTSQVLSRVFEPFFTTKDVGRGSGLGLPQVLGVAQQLGGGVSITSTPGHGTTVRVFLPRAVTTPSPGQRGPDRIDAAGLLRGARLLLVDDDADVREIARVMLEEMGAVVVEADGAASALLQLRTMRVDLVLADLTMPQRTGIELAHDIAAILPGLPVVLMTGYGAAAVDEAAGISRPGSPIRATLQKPFRTEELAELLVRELGLQMRGGTPMPSAMPVGAEG
jgi:signal transduction histidine kinase/ActR/RegA family two-component response regulator